MKALFPGTFDPITKGHLDLIRRAASLFEEVHVVMMLNHEKKALLDVSVRLTLMEESLRPISNIVLDVYEGLSVQYAKDHDIPIMIRGVRSVTDYEYECQIASVNQLLEPEIETMFLLSKPEYASVSSSNAKAVAIQKGDLSSFVDPHVALVLYDAYDMQKR
ncbi:MAG: pantetheine-phosphate adenylyltransferase [Erysipelotrichaceae bacterium]|jgi:pantetheine-phosphate adenylyltransferase|nr:pantetheine-phosphate adenylyltransferase [Erysipelotrichaceae bacterium]